MSTEKPIVMVVEDEGLLLDAIVRKLELNKIEAVSCNSGQQALNYLNDGRLPDVIWLDYYLKDTNGLEFVTKIRENPKWADISVVVVSNSASQEKVDGLLKLGVKRYLIKAEHHLDELIEIVRGFVKKE